MLLCSEVLRECCISTLLRSVGQAGVNLEWVCSYGSELVLSYSSCCLSNPSKLHKRLQIGLLVLVVVSFSPTALTLHMGADRLLWLHDKALKKLETEPQMFYTPFFKSELFFLCVCWWGNSKGPTFFGWQRLLAREEGLGLALGHCQPGRCWRQRRFWDSWSSSQCHRGR